MNWSWRKLLLTKIKKTLTLPLKYTCTSRKWNMWKLILCHSFRKWVHINSRSTQFKPSGLCHNIQKPLTVWSDAILMLDMLCWLVLHMYVIKKKPKKRLEEDVYFPPLTTVSNLREVSVTGLYHSAPYWQWKYLISASQEESWQVAQYVNKLFWRSKTQHSNNYHSSLK